MRNLLVDGKNLSYRCFVGGDFTTKSGEHVEVPFLFVKILSKILRDHPADRVYVCWDGGVSPQRQEYFPQYKRKVDAAIPQDLKDMGQKVAAQFSKLKYVLHHMGTHILNYEHTEADDLIAFITMNKAQDDHLIVSSDKDFLQLVSSRVRVYDGRSKLINLENFAEYNHGLTPKSYLFAHCILGDGSDGIPGIDGIGWGTLHKIRGILNAAPHPEFLKMLLEKIEDYRVRKIVKNYQTLYRNLFLINLKPPKIPVAAVESIVNKLNESRTFASAEVMEFLKQHEMQSLIAKFNYWFAPFMRLI